MDNNFEDSFDDFGFKPLTKGLGFHHSLQEKSRIKSSLKIKSESLKSDLDLRAKKLLAPETDDSASTLTKPVTHMGDLAAFYKPSEVCHDNIPKLKEISRESVDYRFFDAPMFLRLSAWTLDLAFIFIMFLCTISSVFLLADMPFDLLSQVMLSNDILVSFAGMYVTLYFLYFSILDMTEHSSFGKFFFKIKVISTHDENLSFSGSVLRTFYSLLSFCSMGILTILSLTDQMSKTRVVQK